MFDFRHASFRSNSLLSLVLSGFVMLTATQLRASPSTDPASAQSSRPALLTKWHTPEVTSGALAPTIVLRLLVSTDGIVKDAAVKRPRAALADAELLATTAARSFRFQPALQNGTPVESWITYVMPLKLKAAPLARELVVKGSETIDAVLMPAWVAGLRAVQPNTSIRVEALGSSTAFAGLLDGTADVGAASRLINSDEIAFAERLGTRLYEAYAGYDGIAVIVHPDNPLRELTTETLAKVFSEQITNWKELGGKDAPLHVIGRPDYSGTNAFFKESVLGALGHNVDFGAHVRRLEKNEQIVDAIATDPTAIGYVGLGHVRAGVRALALQHAADPMPVSPSPAVVRDGSYPLSRPLVLYLRSDSAHAARALVDFALSDEGQALVEKNGFVRLPGSPATYASEPQAPPIAAPEVIRIYFESDSYAFAADAKLDMTQAEISVRKAGAVLVIGNTDSSGDAQANQRLAKLRADAVAARLRQHAAQGTSIEVQIAVTAHPLATNSTLDGRRANRRVDVIMLKSAPQLLHE